MGIYQTLVGDLGLGNAPVNDAQYAAYVTNLISRLRAGLPQGVEIHCAHFTGTRTERANWYGVSTAQALADSACGDPALQNRIVAGPFTSVKRADSTGITDFPAYHTVIGIRPDLYLSEDVTLRGGFDLKAYAARSGSVPTPSKEEIGAAVIGRVLEGVWRFTMLGEIDDLKPGAFDVVSVSGGEADGVFNAAIRFADGLETWPFVKVNGTWTALARANGEREWMNIATPLAPQGILPLENKSLQKSLSGCGPRGDSSCLDFSVNWPEVIAGQAGVSTAVADLFNEKIRSLLLDNSGSLLGQELQSPDLTVQAERFIADFQVYKADVKEPNPFRWSRGMTVLINDGRVLSLACDYLESTGGAEDNRRVRTLNLRRGDAALIHLPDLFKPGFERQLNSIGERQFRRLKKLSSTQSLSSANFSFVSFGAGPDGFAFSDVWALTADGLAFYYTATDLGNYGQGNTVVTLPWSEITPLLRADADVIPAGK